jgi:hypothetical protein
MPQSRAEGLPVTLPFEKFWAWLQGHSNCIVRAGTPDVLLFDHDDYHWHLAADAEDSALLVQLVRGKDLVGEMVLMPSEITYVQCEASESDEYVFECVVETEATREVAYHFVLTHSYEDEQPQQGRRWTH